MNRSLGLLVLLIALTTAPAWSQDGSLMYEGLSSTTNLTISEDTYRLPHSLDVEKLEKKLEMASELTDQILEQFSIILTQSETDEGNRFRTWDEGRFGTMKAAAAAVQRLTKNLGEEINTIVSIFKVAEQESLPRSVHIAMMERYGEIIRLITFYDIFMDWGSRRRIRFETAMPFNEKWCNIIEVPQYIDFPRAFLPTMARTEANHLASETTDGRGNPVLREQKHLSQTTTVVSLPLNAQALQELLDEAIALIEEAQKAREELQAQSGHEAQDNIRGDHFKSLEYSGELGAFEREIKPIYLRFIVAMIKLKAVRNSLMARISASRNFVTDLNTRGDWAMVERDFVELCQWGDGWIVCYDKWNHIERKYRLLPMDKFSNDFSFGAEKIELDTEKLVLTKTQGKVSTDEMIAMLSHLHTNDRYSTLKTYVPSIYDFTLANAIRLGAYLNTSTRDDFMRWAKDYIK